jgi:hypothetical protein
VAHVANITIAAAQVSADLTDYVVYVDLSDLPTSDFWGTVANGGGDIRCFKSDGTTELAREVVSCDTSTDTGELWIKFSGTLSSSVNTVIQIWTDGGTEPAVTATYGRNAVWTDYTHVYHLNANSAKDSAGNGDLTLAFTSEAATGKFGENATQFDGGADALTPSIAANTTGYYLSAWAKVDSVGGPSSKDLNIATNSQIKVWADAYSGSASRFAHADLSPTSIAYGSDVTEGAWQFFGGLFNGTNGFSAGNGSLSSGASMNGIGAGEMNIGNDNNAADMCEWRYRPTSVSTDWISTEYTNQNTPSTFYTTAALPDHVHVADITIAAAQVAADLTDFPVYVDLSDLPSGFWSAVANGGGDIRCYKSDGTTEIAREVVSCDTDTDTGELWVKFSGTLSSSVDTVIQIHVNGASPDYAATATYGRNNVWTDYIGVWHLNDASDVDSAGKGDINWQTAISTRAGPLSGDVAEFNGSTNFATVTDRADLSVMISGTKATMQSWIYSDVTPPDEYIIFDKNNEYIMHLDEGFKYHWRFWHLWAKIFHLWL